MHKKILLALALSLPLMSCVSREDADANLVKGCQAGIEVLLKEGFKIKEIKNSQFSTSAEFGNGFREGVLTAQVSDGWIDSEKDYKCVFAEEMAFMGLAHSASLYQITVDEETYGKSGDELLGDAATLSRLNAAVEAALAN